MMSSGTQSNRRLAVLAVALSVGFAVATAFIVGICMKSESKSAPVKVWHFAAPYSADPMEYDATVHHIAMRPILASLVTQHRAGTIMGMVADSWSSDETLRTWRFSIRQGLTFSNGDPITPEIVAASIARIARLQHVSGSKSGLTEHLAGIEAFDQTSQNVPGISVSGSEVILAFRDPQPKLLEAISFGLYAIAHPANYDQATGKWRDPRSVIASGPYKIERWDDSSLELKLRDDFPESLRHPSAPTAYSIMWGEKSRSASELLLGNSLDEGLPGKKLYAGGALDVGIYYLHAFSWRLASSALNDISIRRCIRDAFYQELIRLGVSPVRSFLPTSIPGIHEFQSPPATRSERSFSVRFLVGSSSRFADKVSSAVASAVNSCGGSIAKAAYLDSENFVRHLDPDQSAYDADLDMATTGILLEDPVADVKFMVQSKEGIRLPDPTGALAAETRKAKPDLAVINQIIWDDAIVWPVTPFVRGIWATEGAFDFSLINLNLPPTDLSWIGRQ
jgi:hypothetical protein